MSRPGGAGFDHRLSSLIFLFLVYFHPWFSSFLSIFTFDFLPSASLCFHCLSALPVLSPIFFLCYPQPVPYVHSRNRHTQKAHLHGDPQSPKSLCWPSGKASESIRPGFDSRFQGFGWLALGQYTVTGRDRNFDLQLLCQYART